MALKLQVKGVKNALQQVKAYATGKQNAVKKQVAKTLYAVEGRAKKNVRVDTGRLRASIHVVLKGFEGTVETNVSYAYAQEFGDPTRPRYSYTPYLNPAFEAEKQGFLNSIKDIMSQ